MSRVRLTKKTMNNARTAAPNEFSGQNLNTPIRLYDTHPNQRFAVGEDVILVDPAEVNVRGTVLGHIAEDRLLVQWPHEISQEDVDDVMALRESSWRGSDSEVQSMTGSYDRRTSSRSASPGINFWTTSDRKALNFFGNWGSKLDHGVENIGKGIQQGAGAVMDGIDWGAEKLDNGLNYIDQKFENGLDSFERGTQSFWNKVNPFSQQNKDKAIKKGLINQFGTESNALQNYNLFKDPKVMTFLKSYGLSEGEILNFATLRERQLQGFREQWAKANQGFLQNGLANNLPSWGQGGKVQFGIVDPSQVRNYKPGMLSASRKATLDMSKDPQTQKGLNKIQKVANFVEGMLGDNKLASDLRLLPKLVSLFKIGKGDRKASAKKSLAKITTTLADEIRSERRSNPWTLKMASLLEEGMVAALNL
jgi:hypothetical protein